MTELAYEMTLSVMPEVKMADQYQSCEGGGVGFNFLCFWVWGRVGVGCVSIELVFGAPPVQIGQALENGSGVSPFIGIQ